MDDRKILVINPGSTSTKLAYYVGESEVYAERLDHPQETLARFGDIPSQEEFRLKAVEAFMEDRGIDPRSLDAVAARGGLMRPVESGVYRVVEKMVDDLRGSIKRWGREHASSLGGMLALRLSKKYGVPAFTADPVTVDELDDVARLSGVPEITRKSHLHALNIKAAVRRAARGLDREVAGSNFVVAHVGGGTSVAAVRGGRIVDVNNALLGMGPFSPFRAGALPTGDLIGLAFGGKYDREALEEKLVRQSGLAGYTGTGDVREVERRIGEGDAGAGLALGAMAYQTAKEIAAMAAALSGRVDAVVITGGVAASSLFTGLVIPRVRFIARVLVYPGEQEMAALAAHAAAALNGEEEVKEYDDDKEL